MPVARLSAWVALRCKDPIFQRFLGVADEPSAIDTVRRKCGVASRAEFDRDPAAKARFDEIIRFPFIDFSHHQEQQACLKSQ
jgi:hypothetical protein